MENTPSTLPRASSSSCSACNAPAVSGVNQSAHSSTTRRSLSSEPNSSYSSSSLA